jgi:hypothetical protein
MNMAGNGRQIYPSAEGYFVNLLFLKVEPGIGIWGVFSGIEILID